MAGLPDEAAAARFSRLALPHLDAAFRLARWIMRDPAAGEDVAQEAMLRAVTYFQGFRGGNPRAWLLRIVRTTAMTRLAQQSGRREEALDAQEGGAHALLVASDPGPEAGLMERERQARLGQAIAALPQELRECLVLREIEGLSYRDIAAIAGVPVGTVMSRLFRARRTLLQSFPERTP